MYTDNEVKWIVGILIGIFIIIFLLAWLAVSDALNIVANSANGLDAHITISQTAEEDGVLVTKNTVAQTFYGFSGARIVIQSDSPSRIKIDLDGANHKRDTRKFEVWIKEAGGGYKRVLVFKANNGQVLDTEEFTNELVVCVRPPDTEGLGIENAVLVEEVLRKKASYECPSIFQLQPEEPTN